MNKPEEKSSEELQSELLEAKKNAAEIGSIGREINQKGQLLFDFADATYQVIRNTPLHDTETPLRLWQGFNLHARNFIGSLQPTMEYLSLASSSADTATTSVLIHSASSSDPIAYLPSEDQALARAAISHLQSVVSRPQIKQQAQELLIEWGFAHGYRKNLSPIELFETAYLAFEGPVTDNDPALTSLLPMRSCITIVIAELLKRRPQQEQTGNERAKILSIGCQLKWDQLNEDIISIWADQWADINDQLSQSKQADLSREGWGIRLNTATLFLSSFLNGLDQSKCRK
jgi:hypothetical protein